MSIELTREEAKDMIEKLKEVKDEWLEKEPKTKKAYISNKTITQILNNIAGIWDFIIKKEWREEVYKYNKESRTYNFDGYVYHVLGSLRIEGLGVREQYGCKVAIGGKENQNSAYKSAASNAMNKCASMFGVGEPIYAKFKVEQDEYEIIKNSDEYRVQDEGFNQQQQMYNQQQEQQQMYQQQMYNQQQMQQQMPQDMSNQQQGMYGQEQMYNQQMPQDMYNQQQGYNQQQEQNMQNQQQYTQQQNVFNQQAMQGQQTMQDTQNTQEQQGQNTFGQQEQYQPPVVGGIFSAGFGAPQGQTTPQMDSMTEQYQQQLQQGQQNSVASDANNVVINEDDLPFDSTLESKDSSVLQPIESNQEPIYTNTNEIDTNINAINNNVAPIQTNTEPIYQEDEASYVNAFNNPAVLEQMNIFKSHTERLGLTDNNLVVPVLREYFKDENATMKYVSPENIFDINEFLAKYKAPIK